MKIPKKNLLPDMETITPLLIGIWRRFHKLGGPNNRLQTREFRGVVSAVQALQKGLETGDAFTGLDYFAKPELLSAYLLYQWVLHYQQGVALLNEIPNTPKRVLDIASGPGAFSLAALRHGAQEVIALDRNLNSLQIAAEVCGRYGHPLTLRQHNVLRFPLSVEGKFDLIIVGYCLQELFPEKQNNWQELQQAWIQKLLTLLTPNGMILFVESSLPIANKRILSLRDALVKQGIPVQAPCVWRGECPALQAREPCYAQRDLEKSYLIKEIQRASQINLSSLKMSYLLIKNSVSNWPELPEKLLYRVISPPIDSRIGKRYHLCGTDGKKDIGSYLKEQTPETKAFEYLKRGELISVEEVVSKQQHFDIVLGSRVKVEAALNKPLPEKIY